MMTQVDEQHEAEVWGDDNEDEQAAPVEPPRSFWQRLRRIFLPTQRDTGYDDQLYALNAAIRTYPDAAVNYLLRGELYLQTRQRILARADFEQALRFALSDLENERWGLAAQSVADRARQHLAHLPANE